MQKVVQVSSFDSVSLPLVFWSDRSALIGMRRSKRGLRADPAPRPAVSEPCKLWCTCQRPEGGFMICCDVKSECFKLWYHGDCVGITKSQGRRMEQNSDEFVCPICSEAIADVAAATELPPFTPLPPLMD